MSFGLAAEGLPIGTRIAGRYRIEEHLGSGGFGAVFAATDTLRQQRVALKILESRTLDLLGGEARFRREAELARRLQHPNIVAVLDEGSDNGTYYIVFELLHGRSLREELKKWGALSQRRAAEITLQILSGLAAAHAVGIIHRDLKPANIYLLHGSDQAKLLDFGIAKSTNPDTLAGLTRDGQMLGTPAYMAPEQLTNKDIAPATDIFALGAVLLEMLLGRNPFPHEMPAMLIVRARLQGEPLPMPDALRDKPLGQVILRATQHRPADRYATVEQMRDAIVAVLHAPGFVDSVVITSTAPSSDTGGATYANPYTAGPYTAAHTPTAHGATSASLAWAPHADESRPQHAPQQMAPLPYGQPPGPLLGLQPAPRSGGGNTGALLAVGALALLILAIGSAAGIFFALRSRAGDDDPRHEPARETPDDDAAQNDDSENDDEEADEEDGDVAAAVAAARVVSCPGAASQNPATLAQHLRAISVQVTGDLIYCAGNMTNMECDSGDGRGVTVAPSGNVAVVRFRNAAQAGAFLADQNRVGRDTTWGKDGSTLLLAELPHAVADKLLARVCRAGGSQTPTGSF